jgi:hypothetical protein
MFPSHDLGRKRLAQRPKPSAITSASACCALLTAHVATTAAMRACTCNRCVHSPGAGVGLPNRGCARAARIGRTSRSTLRRRGPHRRSSSGDNRTENCHPQAPARRIAKHACCLQRRTHCRLPRRPGALTAPCLQRQRQRQQGARSPRIVVTPATSVRSALPHEARRIRRGSNAA